MPKVYRHPELERRIQERLFVRIAKAHEPRIKRELAAQYNAAAAGNKIKDGRMVDTIAAIMRDGYNQIGSRAATAIRDSQGKSIKRAVPMDPAFEAGLNDYIDQYSAMKVKDVSDTTKARIALITRQGIDEGLTGREVADRIRQLGLTDPPFRASVIARTESHSAANAGGLESAIESDVVKEKEWISTEDERTRDGENSEFDHTNVANAQVDEPFIVSGEELMFPGDPSGSAGNIINCRCCTGYVV